MLKSCQKIVIILHYAAGAYKSCPSAPEFGGEAIRNQWLATFPSPSTVGAYPASLDISEQPRETSELVPLSHFVSGHLRHRAKITVQGHARSLIKKWSMCFPLPRLDQTLLFRGKSKHPSPACSWSHRRF